MVMIMESPCPPNAANGRDAKVDIDEILPLPSRFRVELLHTLERDRCQAKMEQ